MRIGTPRGGQTKGNENYTIIKGTNRNNYNSYIQGSPLFGEERGKAQSNE
jgi:hypothetical protein